MAIVTEGGSGLIKGIRYTFSEAMQVRDLFHILYKLSMVRRLVESKCYAMIAAKIKLLGSKCGPEVIDTPRIEMNDALIQFDLFEASIKDIKKTCYLADEKGHCFVTAAPDSTSSSHVE